MTQSGWRLEQTLTNEARTVSVQNTMDGLEPSLIKPTSTCIGLVTMVNLCCIHQQEQQIRFHMLGIVELLGRARRVRQTPCLIAVEGRSGFGNALARFW